jgi:prepilin-type N-terminal cleavage/methylation domain-containing protein
MGHPPDETHNRQITRQAGFTLVELVLVIVLTLVLTAASIKGINGVGEWRAAAAVRRVNADITYARNQALLSGRRTLWVLDTGDQTYEIRQEAAPASGAITAASIDHPLTDESWVVTIQDLSSGLAASSDDPVFGFGSDGTVINSSGSRLTDDVVVTFDNGATITVTAGSGLSQVSW